MNSIMITLFLDVSVATLLVVTIYFCVKLNKRVQQLQDSKSELAQLIKEFDESTQAATVSIHEIHRASKKINENIQTKLEKANYLADDLAFMIERANKSADRIEQKISAGRSSGSVSKQASPSRSSRSSSEVKEVPAAGTEQITSRHSSKSKERRASRSSSNSSSPMRTSRDDEMVPPPDKKGIEAMMDRITELRTTRPSKTAKVSVSDSKMKQTSASKAKKTPPRMRTKSEQDLMQALRKEENR